MARIKKEIGYNAIFPTRLRALLDDLPVDDDGHAITQQRLAVAVGVTRQAVGQWCAGNTVPDIICLKKIAELFHVSADYLIGLSAVATTDTNIKEICKFTGLSEKACLALAECAGNKPWDWIDIYTDEKYEDALGEYLDNCSLYGKPSIEILSYFLEHEFLTALRFVNEYKINLEESTDEAVAQAKELVEYCDDSTDENKREHFFDWLLLDNKVFRSQEKGRLKYFEAQDFVRKLIDAFVFESVEENAEAISDYRSATMRAFETTGGL